MFPVSEQSGEIRGLFGDIEFTVVNERVAFDTAKSRCQERNATLARLPTQAEHEAAVDLMNSFFSLSPEDNVWIGEPIYVIDSCSQYNP